MWCEKKIFLVFANKRVSTGSIKWVFIKILRDGKLGFLLVFLAFKYYVFDLLIATLSMYLFLDQKVLKMWKINGEQWDENIASACSASLHCISAGQLDFSLISRLYATLSMMNTVSLDNNKIYYDFSCLSCVDMLNLRMNTPKKTYH